MKLFNPHLLSILCSVCVFLHSAFAGTYQDIYGEIRPLYDTNGSTHAFNGHLAPNASLSGVDLSGADLSQADLTGATLAGTNLTNANLTGANLSESTLVGASLMAATIVDSDLRGAQVSGMNITGADLSYSNLSGLNLTGLNFGETTLVGTNLSITNLSYRNLSNLNLSHANLSGANLTGSNLSFANLTQANLKGAVLFFTDLTSTQTNGINLKDVITDEPLTGILISKVSESEERIAALEAELAAIKADSSDDSETFTLSEILDLRPGSIAIQVTGENVDITFELEESEDLGRNDPWTPTGHKVTMTIPANTEHKFFRFAP